jgi:hypothetical protein
MPDKRTVVMETHCKAVELAEPDFALRPVVDISLKIELSSADGNADAALLIGVGAELQELLRGYLDARSKLLRDGAEPNLCTGLVRIAQTKGAGAELRGRAEPR